TIDGAPPARVPMVARRSPGGPAMHGPTVARVLVVSIVLVAATVRAAILVVPDQYPSIQAAVDVALAGDRVQVRRGTYAERVRIETGGITIEGLGGRPLVTPPGGQDGFRVQKVDGVGITGVDVTGGSRGIRIDGSVGSSVTDCVISG